jgi:hypothetical protein
MDKKCREELLQAALDLLKVALELSEDESASLVEESLRDDPPEPHEWDDDELALELGRRFEEALGDPTTTVPWSELRFPG